MNFAQVGLLGEKLSWKTHGRVLNLRSRNVKRFRGGLVFKAHRLLHHSTRGLSVVKKKKSRYDQTRRGFKGMNFAQLGLLGEKLSWKIHGERNLTKHAKREVPVWGQGYNPM